MGALDGFSPLTREWFAASFAAPTDAQAGAWESISAGRHTLVVAPTGSGKTLAAFLAAIDKIATADAPEPKRRTRVLYISPLKALAVDVERNLRSPLTGIRHVAARLGRAQPEVTVGMRTGDTPPDERRALVRRPPDILITTPESLFLLLTSAAREALRGIDTVIVDEVHAVCATKRGAHLAVSLERLDALLDAPAQRIGLSATVRPVEEVAAFLAGGRPVDVVAPQAAKIFDLQVVVPVEDMAEPSLTAPRTSGLPDTDGASDEDLGAAELDGGEFASGRICAVPTDDRLYPTGSRSAAGSAVAPRASIWPAVEDRVLDLVQAHRSTIVFANSRRLAERLTARINELAYEREYGVSLPLAVGARAPAEAIGQSGAAAGAPPVVARSHHGSVSREQRAIVEEELKSGRLPAVVATSSLELGIDMGAVDLVVQVEAPPSVASGLQRIGRAGHQVGAVSQGVIFPKFRGDLVSCAVVAERMVAGAIEAIRYPRNPLDVLAQQIVAMVSMDEWDVSDLAELLRRSAPYAALPTTALEAVLDMLAGRYPADAFAELRPRLVWDRVAGTLRARPGAQRLAVTSGGTIPDRGLFGVFTAGESPTRVGELDEEMVYESRVGDVFLLGTSSWRIEDITHDRVVVVPAPGQPGRMPFWKGDSIGRPLELGRAVGAFLRELSTLSPDAAATRLAGGGLDSLAVRNLLTYLEEQRTATGQVPDDRTIVVERFRDELGDWRLVVHSTFGAQVNAPWALAISGRLRERYGTEAMALHTDDGIVLRLPDTDNDPPDAGLVLFEPEEIEAVVTDAVGGSPLFASRFRECSARALLLPKRDPRRRAPLWQQRQRAAQLLDVAREYPAFPVILETMRECLQDVFDLPGLVSVMRDLVGRTVRVVEVETSAASPFAQSLLFGYVGAFVYEGDAPLAERRAQALALDTSLLAELLGNAELRELLDPEALAEVEAEVSWRAPDRHARSAEATADLLRIVGDLSVADAAERGVAPAWLAELEATRRAIRVRIGSQERYLAVEDAGRVRDGLGVALPPGVPDVFTQSVRDPLGDLVSRYARCHGPFRAEQLAARFGLGVAVAGDVLRRLAATGRVVAGEFRPGGAGTEWCDPDVLRRLRRRSLARLRDEIEPVGGDALARFLPSWCSVGPFATRGVDALARAVEQLAGCAVPASALESTILPARVRDYSPAMLDELTSAGEVAWTGAGSLPGGDGWVVLAPTEGAALLLPEPPATVALTPLHNRILDVLDGDAALFFGSLSDRVYADSTAAGLERPESLDGHGPAAATAAALGPAGLDATGSAGSDSALPGLGPPDDAALADAVWDLVWAGYLSNDTLAALRARAGGADRRRALTPPRHRRGRFGRIAMQRPGAGQIPADGAAGAFSRGEPVGSSLAAGTSAAPASGRTAATPLHGGTAATSVRGTAGVWPPRGRRATARQGGGPPSMAGRWFRLPASADPTRRSHARVEAMLDRHGVLTRGAVTAEGMPGGFAAAYKVLHAAEEAGQVRRGYAVAGLGAAQFALPGAVDRLRGFARDRRESAPAIVLAATDPANPYGAALPWPARPDRSGTTHRPGRKAGAVVVTVDGALTLYLERGGKSVLSWSDDLDTLHSTAAALAATARGGGLGRLTVVRADGLSVLGTPLSRALEASGFRPTPRGLRFRD